MAEMVINVKKGDMSFDSVKAGPNNALMNIYDNPRSVINKRVRVTVCTVLFLAKLIPPASFSFVVHKLIILY